MTQDRMAASRAEGNVNAPAAVEPEHLRSGPIGQRQLTTAERTMGNTAGDIRARIERHNRAHTSHAN